MAVVACAERVYQAMLKRASRLLPIGVPVCFLADRGFADTQLMRYLRDELHWHFRIRVKSNTWIHRPHKGWKQLNTVQLSRTVETVLSRSKQTERKNQPFRQSRISLNP